MDLRRLTTPVANQPRDGRVVERYPAMGLRLRWHPPTAGWFRIRPRPAEVEVIDLSVSGALLVAPANPVIQPGVVVALEGTEGRGRVEVRHVHACLDPDQQYYGVLFLELEPELRRELFDAVARQRGDRGDLEWLWRHAT